MSIENNIETFLKHEKELLFIKKKAEIGFWDYQILGLFSFLLNRKNDYLIITDKRVMYGLKDEIIKKTRFVFLGLSRCYIMLKVCNKNFNHIKSIGNPSFAPGTL